MKPRKSTDRQIVAALMSECAAARGSCRDCTGQFDFPYCLRRLQLQFIQANYTVFGGRLHAKQCAAALGLSLYTFKQYVRDLKEGVDL